MLLVNITFKITICFFLFCMLTLCSTELSQKQTVVLKRWSVVTIYVDQ